MVDRAFPDGVDAPTWRRAVGSDGPDARRGRDGPRFHRGRAAPRSASLWDCPARTGARRPRFAPTPRVRPNRTNGTRLRPRPMGDAAGGHVGNPSFEKKPSEMVTGDAPIANSAGIRGAEWAARLPLWRPAGPRLKYVRGFSEGFFSEVGQNSPKVGRSGDALSTWGLL